MEKSTVKKVIVTSLVLATVTFLIVSCPSPGGGTITTTPITQYFLYTANSYDGTVSAYTINTSTGALTPGSTLTISGSSPAGAVVDPTGKFLYVSVAFNTSGSVYAYTVNASNGTLTAVSG